jgi:hypothetical protein
MNLFEEASLASRGRGPSAPPTFTGAAVSPKLKYFFPSVNLVTHLDAIIVAIAAKHGGSAVHSGAAGRPSGNCRLTWYRVIGERS